MGVGPAAYVGRVLLAEVVRTSEAVAATQSRLAKVASLADLLRRLGPDEVEPAVAFLTGRPRQGKIGVGWASLRASEQDPPPAPDPSIEILEFDRAITDLQVLTGQGSVGRRRALLDDLFGRATADEAEFVRRLLIGDLRQGALDGVMTDAVARATGISLATVRRAAMLAGDLARVAAVALVDGEPGLSAIGLEVLRPILPMLASTSADVESALASWVRRRSSGSSTGPAIQAHRAGGEVRLFTRNLNDITDRLPTVVDLLRTLDLDRVVLDGEVLGVSDEGPEAFQETMSSFGRRTAGGRSGTGLPRRVVLRRPPPRRRRPPRPAPLRAVGRPRPHRRAPGPWPSTTDDPLPPPWPSRPRPWPPVTRE